MSDDDLLGEPVSVGYRKAAYGKRWSKNRIRCDLTYGLATEEQLRAAAKAAPGALDVELIARDKNFEISIGSELIGVLSAGISSSLLNSGKELNVVVHLVSIFVIKARRKQGFAAELCSIVGELYAKHVIAKLPGLIQTGLESLTLTLCADIEGSDSADRLFYDDFHGVFVALIEDAVESMNITLDVDVINE